MAFSALADTPGAGGGEVGGAGQRGMDWAGLPVIAAMARLL